MANIKNAKKLRLTNPYWDFAEGRQIIGTITDKREKKSRFPRVNKDGEVIDMDRVLIIRTAAKTHVKAAKVAQIGEAGTEVAVNLKPIIRDAYNLPLGSVIAITCTGRVAIEGSPNLAWQFDVEFADEGSEIEFDLPPQSPLKRVK